MHVHEEVTMVPEEFEIDDSREKQDMWLLEPSGKLIRKLDLKIPNNIDDAFLTKEWLTTDNWKPYLQQVIEFFGTGKKKMALWVSKQQKPFKN